MIVLEKKSLYQMAGIDISPYSTKEYFYSDTQFKVNSSGAVKIGKGTYININALIIAEKKISIGRNCKISWDVIIMDTEFQETDKKSVNHNPVVIEDEVSIGSNCIILKGVTIGKGSIVAAGSVVMQDIPPYSIYGGSPARHIADIDPSY